MNWQVRQLDTTPSTNDYLLARAADMPPGTVVWTENQTTGRGRLGRPWVRVEGGALAFSLLLVTNSSGVNHHGQIGALAMAEALGQLGHPVLLKWPNDLRVARAKLGGVLAETTGKFLVLGIGLNLRDPLGQLASLDQKATCLERGPAPVPDPVELIGLFLKAFEAKLLAAEQEGFKALLPQWKDLAEEGGRSALLRRTPGGPEEPVWVGQTLADGRLRVRHSDGREEDLASGDLLY